MSTPQGWQTPKTNWDSKDPVGVSDLNRMEGNPLAIETGDRTLDPAQAPSSNTGTLRQILSWFANRLKAITGAANWYDAPVTTLAATKSHMDATSVHGATSSATANRIIIRDSAGRAKVAAPSASDDIARKAEVDAVSSALNTHRSSGDHDGRYYTKSRLDPIIRNLLLNHWTVFHSGTMENLYNVAYANGLWVAVGANGTILTSTNGTSWTSRTSGTTNGLWGVAYANGLWVAVGNSGTILTSPDGTSSWTSRSSGTSENLRGVAYADGLWVATGGSGTILTSPDGTSSWTPRTSGTTVFLYNVAYANGLWVAVGNSGTISTARVITP
jgi:hypothetical protein